MKFAIIGAGSWGTAIAQLVATNGHEVTLWALEREVVTGINENHINPIYLSNAKLHESIRCSNDMGEALCGAEAVAIVTPSQFLRSTAKSMASHLGGDIPILVCSKGAEEQSGDLANEVIVDELGGEGRVAILSGPTHAEEVIAGVPTAATCACINASVANLFRDTLSNGKFRVYTSFDVRGVEICAAFKNVIAIAVGISYGLGFGDNTAALILTRGVAEMARMLAVCGGDPLTCQGLAGIGDLVVTCMSRHSRNRRFGEDYLTQGKTLDDFKEETKMVVEGAIAAKNLQVLSKKHNVDLPITRAVYRAIYEGADLRESANELFSRPLKPEFLT